jgi:3-methyladenine DNA glycosylase/8-oxoguanine DNA glycosylase
MKQASKVAPSNAMISVKDLASRFADDRLSTEKLIAADDEELAKMLIEVRGIGRVSLSCISSRTIYI